MSLIKNFKNWSDKLELVRVNFGCSKLAGDFCMLLLDNNSDIYIYIFKLDLFNTTVFFIS